MKDYRILKTTFLSTAFCYARYANGMEDLTGIDIKKQLNITFFSKEKFLQLKRWNRWTYLHF